MVVPDPGFTEHTTEVYVIPSNARDLSSVSNPKLIFIYLKNTASLVIRNAKRTVQVHLYVAQCRHATLVVQ